MPIYEYQCQLCHHKTEVLQKISDPALSVCPECHKSSFNKVISSPAGFELKGTGWYVTDFKNAATKPSENSGSKAE